MSVAQIVTKFIWHFEAKKPAFSVMNFANPDMVGHTGIFDATCKAVAATDLALGKLADYCLKSEIDLIITADHGNAEQMINIQTGEVDKEHTTNPVPIIIAFKEKFKKNSFPVSQDAKIALAAQSPIGVLSDVTSTIITRFGLRLPGEMTGNDLSQFLS
jgi:2,3-bisphosphoglycerate-independent phosphoglycerate mutase